MGVAVWKRRYIQLSNAEEHGEIDVKVRDDNKRSTIPIRIAAGCSCKNNAITTTAEVISRLERVRVT